MDTTAITERPVAFDVAEVTGEGATSVVLRGTARTIETEARAAELDLADLHSWSSTPRTTSSSRPSCEVGHA